MLTYVKIIKKKKNFLRTDGQPKTIVRNLTKITRKWEIRMGHNIWVYYYSTINSDWKHIQLNYFYYRSNKKFIIYKKKFDLIRTFFSGILENYIYKLNKLKFNVILSINFI